MLLVGLYYLRFENGDLRLNELEAEVADVLDAYGGLRLDVEGWSQTMEGESELPTSVTPFLEDLGRDAALALLKLDEIDQLKADPFFCE